MKKRYIKSYGVSNNFIKRSDNDDLYINKLKWVGKYDGKKADIDLDINNNGEKQHYDIELDNDEIKRLLNVHSIDKPLEDRLLEDYLSKPTEQIDELISYKLPTSVSASASKSRSRSRSSAKSSAKSKSRSSAKSKTRSLKTNVSRLRTSISHSRGSLNKSKRSKSRSSSSRR
jgi:hypothetical protein